MSRLIAALTTPSMTVSWSAGRASFCDAISTSTRRASAAAMRICLPPNWMPVEPDAPPWFTVVRGVAHVDVHGLERHVELFGDDLADRDEQAVAHVHLAEEGRDGAVGVDGDVGGELSGVSGGFAPCAIRLVACRVSSSSADRRADRDDERAGALQHRAAGEIGGIVVFCHAASLNPSSWRRA